MTNTNYWWIYITALILLVHLLLCLLTTSSASVLNRADDCSKSCLAFFLKIHSQIDKGKWIWVSVSSGYFWREESSVRLAVFSFWRMDRRWFSSWWSSAISISSSSPTSRSGMLGRADRGAALDDILQVTRIWELKSGNDVGRAVFEFRREFHPDQSSGNGIIFSFASTQEKNMARSTAKSKTVATTVH